MPAIGVAVNNVLSGMPIRVYQRGMVPATITLLSGMLCSGNLYVGASGTITGTRPVALSGIMNPVIQSIGSLSPFSGNIDVNIMPVGPALPRPVTLVVDPYGNGDFRYVVDAVRNLPPQGGTIMLREGRHMLQAPLIITQQSVSRPITFVGMGATNTVTSGGWTRGNGTILDLTSGATSGGAIRIGAAGNYGRRNDITFRNLTFRSDDPSKTAFSFLSNNSDNFNIENCRFDGFGSCFQGSWGEDILSAPGRLLCTNTTFEVPWYYNSGANVFGGFLSGQAYFGILYGLARLQNCNVDPSSGYSVGNTSGKVLEGVVVSGCSLLLEAENCRICGSVKATQTKFRNVVFDIGSYFVDASLGDTVYVSEAYGCYFSVPVRMAGNTILRD
jgi:hypothetical protein